MKAITIITSFLLSGILLSSCMEKERPLTERKAQINNVKNEMPYAALVKRGEYLVGVIGCDDCHSPKAGLGENGDPLIDYTRRLSGHPANKPLAVIKDPSIIKDYLLFDMDLTAAVGPWGISYAANLTPDVTGIGEWTEERFMKAIREGKFKGLDGGRPLMPPMPWFIYKNMTDDDLKAIFAYLKSLPPVNNIVPAYQPPVN